ncbi:glucose-1-phosphate adenylyltransferase subunit GlgD [Alkalibacterium kapii]|uniref:Glucose-1-phosphate adenylyltransferase subunit GlgD n=1 Tax=Alkalibacterium kapii TaxID=426704 RepID=A0A511AQE0_9LACT|nr:glucose-1-phosphate adenylyltransferase subunit GlgD [Alkalibacterium kapii]GEK90424.1 glucose-1-phosphate adenylyltransferase subunit GlgD [Alkalibacterium kapii]
MRIKIAPILNLVENSEKLKPLTNRRPVASLPFGCRYRLIDFPFSSLTGIEASSAALFIAGSGHSLYDHIRSGATWGLESSVGGGVFTHSHINLKAELADTELYTGNYYDDHYHFVSRSNADYVLLMGSSMLSNIQLDSLVRFHEKKESDATVIYKKIKRKDVRKDSTHTSLIMSENDSERIAGLHSLDELTDEEEAVLLNMEMMILDKETFLNHLYSARQQQKDVTVKNLIQFSLDADKTVFGYEYTGYLKVIEDINSYYQANMDMLNEDNFNALFYRANPVLTKPKNSAPTYYGKKSEINNVQFANDCEIYGKVQNSIIFRKVNIAEGAEVNNSIIMQDSYVEEDAYLNYVILDKHVYVKKGARLEGTPENPIVVAKDSIIYAEGEIEKGE